MIYHLLPELEPFSADRGGALSHTVANLMRLDRHRSVVCIDADHTWNYGSDRLLVVPRLRLYLHLRARRFYPPVITGPLLRWIYAPLLARLKRGDIVWFHNRPVFAAALAEPIRSKGAGVVCHFHDGLNNPALQRSLRKLQPDVSIFVSEFIRRYWLSQFPHLQNTFTAHNGADDALFFPSDDKPTNPTPVILYVGRLHCTKGIHILMEAMRILHKHNTKALCRVVGSSFSGGSNATPFVQSIIRTAPPTVEFVGHRSATAIAEEYRAADIFCCPSLWEEPFGKVNVEAMACGLPVVATRVGGIPEIASEGGILLVEPNSPAALALALESLIKDNGLRAKLASEGVKSFRRQFTWTSALKRYHEITSGLRANVLCDKGTL